MADKQKTTVAIVGAGISGLSAAKLLNESGVDVVVLEAHDRVGGRTYSIQNPKCQYCDLGGSYVGPTQDRILRMAKELGIQTYKVNEEEHLVIHTRGKTKLFKGAFPPLGNPLAVLDLNNALRTMDEYCEQIPLDAPWKAPKAKEWDQITFADFLEKILWTRAAKDFLYLYHRVIVASEPHENSLLWFLYYVKRCDGTARIFATSEGGQEQKMAGGSMQISTRMADKLGDRVLLEHPVNKINQSGSNVVLTTLDESKFEADYVILANAIALQQKITYTPSLPPLRNQVIQRIPMGTVIKTMMYYPTTFWIEKDMCGSAMIIDEDLPVLFALSDTKPDGSFPCLCGFITGDKARRFGQMTKEERCRKVAEGYAKAFQCQEALNFSHYEEKVWAEDPWTGGCYTAHFPPGLLTQYGKILREPVGRLYFAGTETALHWAGYMEGAVEAGERAAREVLFALGKIRKDEIWQPEPMSKEVPSRPLESTFLERHLPSVPGFLKLMGTTTFLSGLAAGLFAYKKYIK